MYATLSAVAIQTPLERKVEAAERLVSQGYLKKTAAGGVILTKRGELALEEFTGGPLVRDSFDLDSAYYGTVHANRRRNVTWARKFLNAWADLESMASLAYMPGEGESDPPDLAAAKASVDAPRPNPESTSYWMRHFHEIDEPNLVRLYKGGWEKVTCWRIDVHRAVAEIAKKRSRSRLQVFALYCEGWSREEIGQLMRSMNPGEEWSEDTVRSHIKEVSRVIRRRVDAHMPKAGFVDEDIAPTSLAHRAEDAIAWARQRQKPRKSKPKAA